MSRPLGFFVPYQEDDGANGSYAKFCNIRQFIPLSAIETIFKVNGGYWTIRTLAGNEYSCGYDEEEGYPEAIVIEELRDVGIADMEEMEELKKRRKQKDKQ